MWVSALRTAKNGSRARYLNSSGALWGYRCITPDSFPVFDTMRENCFVLADSNHGYKMIGVGDLVARTICGESQSLLRPFRFSRYEEGDLHPVSNSPFPWS